MTKKTLEIKKQLQKYLYLSSSKILA